MTSIFENAYFGKSYRTRSGRKALYIYQVDNDHLLYVEGEVYPDSYPSNGLLLERDSKFDIVSEWQEPVEEEKLDTIAFEAEKETFKTTNLPYQYKYVEGFKAGYRAALKQ